MNLSFEQYFKCPAAYAKIAQKGPLSQSHGFFQVGPGITAFGRRSETVSSPSPSNGHSQIVINESSAANGVVTLPFDLQEVVDELRLEKYAASAPNRKGSLLATMYYGIRPLLPVSIRKHLQRVRLNDWENIPFPRWPVDRTVDDIFHRVMLLELKANKLERIPFIWFWPEGRSSCAVMTHDVETTRGKDFCKTLMDIDDQFGIKASFQVVPERRYEVPSAYLQSIRDRGFEVGVQDLNHDGHLYKTKDQFLSRAGQINAYGRLWDAQGFRAAVLYRRQEWFDALEFEYDMSVPNVAHLDPQRGGCCTVMPYFAGKILELPVTTTQDYSLFHILKDYSIDLWKQQIALVMEKNGLISFIIHPDYITNGQERACYESLLGYLAKIRQEQDVWIPTPGEANQWWRQRAAMKLVEENGRWRIEGEGHERARVAYASEENGRLKLMIEASVKTFARK
jgi:hypothetical protein